MREILNTEEDERTGVAYGARAGTWTRVGTGIEECATEVMTLHIK